MSKYMYEREPQRLDLVDDLGYDESELDAMHPDDVYDLACSILADSLATVRRV